MNEPFDVYADSFSISISTWGAKLSFALTPRDADPTEIEAPLPLGTIRMSNELLKAMVVLLRDNIREREEEHEVRFDVPSWILEQLGMDDEEWDEFWGYDNED